MKMYMPLYQLTLWRIGLFLLYGFLLAFFLTHGDRFFIPFDYITMGKTYGLSQYVLGPASKAGIGDDGVYAFAGYYYLFQGGDVSSVNFEHPPLGKYLIGLSIFLTGNENSINIFYYIFFLWTTYLVARRLDLHPLSSLAATWLVAINPLFLDHTLRSLLDLPFSLCVLLGIFFFLPRKAKPVSYGWSFFFTGCAFSIRFYPFFFVQYLLFAYIVFRWRRPSIVSFVLYSLWVPAIYLLTHISYFVYHPSIIEFLRHKKWMVAWFMGSPKIPGNIWRNVMTGWYADSTGVIAHNQFWDIGLPVFVSAGVSQIRLIPCKDSGWWIVSAWSVLFLAYVTVLTNGDEKFLFPVLPLLYIFAMRLIESLCDILTPLHGRRPAHRN